MEIKCYVGNCTQLDTAVQFLNSIAADFPIPLDQKTDIRKLVEKVYQYGYIIFAEAEHDIVGINMIYANDQVDRCAWITVLGVDKEYRRYGVAGRLIGCCEKIAKENSMTGIALFVHSENIGAVKMYQKYGFRENKDIEAKEDKYITLYKLLEN